MAITTLPIMPTDATKKALTNAYAAAASPSATAQQKVDATKALNTAIANVGNAATPYYNGSPITPTVGQAQQRVVEAKQGLAAKPAIEPVQPVTGGSGGVNATALMGAYQQQLAARQAAMQADYDRLVAQQGANYNAMRAQYADLLAQQQAARKAAYDNTEAAHRENYDYNAGQVNSAADNALQQAYVNRMMNQRTMAQQLAAMGMGGGANETTMARLLNAYAANRAGTENNRAAQIAGLGNTLANNLAVARNTLNEGNANDLAAYNQSLANLEAANQNALLALAQNHYNNINNSNDLYYQYLTQLMGAL